MPEAHDYMTLMRTIRTYVSGLLMLALVLTGQSMAIARGMSGAVGYSELCIGATPVMVPVDADGAPTGPPHICPEFSLSLLNWVPSADIALIDFVPRESRAVIDTDNSAYVIRLIEPTARAPPVFS